MSKLECEKSTNYPQTRKRMENYEIGQETDIFPICNLNYTDQTTFGSDRRNYIDSPINYIYPSPKVQSKGLWEWGGAVCVGRDPASKLQVANATLLVMVVKRAGSEMNAPPDHSEHAPMKNTNKGLVRSMR